MKSTARGLVCALAGTLILTVPAARAGTREGVSMPNAVSVAGERLVLNGMGVRKATVLNVKVYVAGLYLESPSSEPRRIVTSDETKRLTLRFLREVGRDDIVKAFDEGFAKNNSERTVEALNPRIRRLNSWMKGIDEGGSIGFTHVPDSGVQVTVNGKLRGTIPGDDFARALFAIWLGPHPPNQELKKGLLGRG